MTFSSIRFPNATRGLALRAFWVAMFASHAPALWSSLNADSLHVGRILLMLVSQTFFLFKALDLAWLRLPPCPRLRRAVIAGFVLLHAQAIERNIAHDPDSPLAWNVVVLGGSLSAVGLAATPLLRRSSSSRPPRRGWVTLDSACIRRALMARLERLPLRFLCLARGLIPDRAPPLPSVRLA